MAEQGEMDEVLRGTVSSSREPVDDALLSNDGNFTPKASQDQTPTDAAAFPVELHQEEAAREDQDNSSGDEDSLDGKEAVAVLSEADENSENERCPGQEGDETKYDYLCSIDEKDLKSLSYNLDGVETNVPTPSRLRTSHDTVEQVDLSWRLATDIQHGEQLLQRLQMVQLRHDDIPNDPHGIEDAGVGGVSSRSEGEGERPKEKSDNEEDEEVADLNTVKEEETKSNLQGNKNEEPLETEPRLLSTAPELPEQDLVQEIEGGESLDSWSEIFETSDLAFQETSRTTIPFKSTADRLSAAVTSKQRNIHEATQGKQNLQRAEGLLDLAVNPDVLEIPFKTDLSFESLLTQACTSRLSPWQFSEKKMQKEINQEIQRELVLVNQGKIPGDYSKGEARQLKETKMLFEAFQLDSKKGPARVKEGLRKLPSEVMTGGAYPSVLERTQSLEMFSIKTCPVARAQSFRLNNSATTNRDKSPENAKSRHPDNLRPTSPENFRSKSPTGMSRDKARLSPYSKQEKHLRLHRSMDSISGEASTSAAKSRDKTKEGDLRRESPILKPNPFFTLRPSLALQPEVAKDIREAREREEELRRQRCKLYGELRQKSEDEEKSRCTPMFRPEATLQSRGKLERIWPPPPKRDQKPESLQQEVKVRRSGGQTALLWRRWESGRMNEQAADEKK